MQSPAHVFQVAVVEEGVAVELHPHADLLDADGSDLSNGVPGNEKKSVGGEGGAGLPLKAASAAAAGGRRRLTCSGAQRYP